MIYRKHVLYYFYLVFFVLLSGLYSCDKISQIRGNDQEETEFKILPNKITFTEIGLRSDIEVVKPEEYDESLVAWETSDSSVVSVNNGTISAVSSGEATIVAKYDNATTLRDTARVKIIDTYGRADDITVTPRKKKFKQIGKTIKLTASITPSDISQGVTWKTLNPNIASVSANGRVTVKSAGTAKIVATPENDTTQSDTAYVSLEVDDDLVFAVAPGLRKNNRSFRYALQQIKNQASDARFVITPGNLDPIEKKHRVFKKIMGATFPWYPVMDYHILPGKGHESVENANIKWVRNYFSVIPAVTNPGPNDSPAIQYSFDYGNVHITIINPFYTGGGDISQKPGIRGAAYSWLENDLKNYTKPYNFVVCGVPAYPLSDNFPEKRRFRSEQEVKELWELLEAHDVMAYFTGGNKAGIDKKGTIHQVATGNALDNQIHFFLIRIQSSKVIIEQFRGRLNGNFRKITIQNIPLEDYS